MFMEMDKPVQTCSVISILLLPTAAFVFHNLHKIKEKVVVGSESITS